MTLPDVLDLAAIRRRCDAATEGPWHVVGPPWNDREPYIIHGDPNPYRGGYVADLCCLSDDINAANNEQADAEFIAHARTDLPALLAAYDRVCAERDGWFARFRAAVDVKDPS